MEQLEEDVVRGPMRQEDTITRLREGSQDDCSASYDVRDEDRANDKLPRQETGSERYEDV